MSLPKNDQTDALFRSILELRTAEECYAYFEDLLTIKEVESVAQRLEVARLLRDGCSYKEAAERTHVSSATICRVNRCLEYGTGGYELVLRRMEETK